MLAGCIGIGARGHPAPAGAMPGADPHLLAVEQVVVLFLLRTGLQAGEVAARIGFAVAGAPHAVVLARRNHRDILLLLLFGTEQHERRPYPGDTADTHRIARDAPVADLFEEDGPFPLRSPHPAVRFGPGDGQPPLVGEFLGDGHAEIPLFVIMLLEVGHLPLGEILSSKLADLLPQSDLSFTELKIHICVSPYLNSIYFSFLPLTTPSASSWAMVSLSKPSSPRIS